MRSRRGPGTIDSHEKAETVNWRSPYPDSASDCSRKSRITLCCDVVRLFAARRMRWSGVGLLIGGRSEVLRHGRQNPVVDPR
jgi:hypothetical protein